MILNTIYVIHAFIKYTFLVNVGLTVYCGLFGIKYEEKECSAIYNILVKGATVVAKEFRRIDNIYT